MRDEARRGSMDGDIDTDGCVYRLGFNGQVCFQFTTSTVGDLIEFILVYLCVCIIYLIRKE